MSKKKNTLAQQSLELIDEAALFKRVSAIIEKRKYQAASFANREVTLMYWEIGQYINSIILENKRAEYGKKILTVLAAKLVKRYGNCFVERNLYRMTLFAERFPDAKILPPLAAKLSWSHIIELLPLKNDEARMYYANDVVTRNYSTKELRRQIARKAYERRGIADSQLTAKSEIPFNTFKDPYLLDILGLKDNFLEADLEKAILAELEVFILEFGHGFTFVERQKRMTIDGDAFTLDLLFYHRILKRLVAVELKIEKFRPGSKGKWNFI